MAAGDAGGRADRITGIALVVLGLGVAVESWRMPRMSEFGASAWAAPGVVPGMVGLLLAVMGAVLHQRARARAGRGTDGGIDVGAWRRVGITLLLCLGFAGGAVGAVSFAFAAFGFTLLFILVFDRADRAVQDGAVRWTVKRIALAIGVAAASSLLITTVFEDVFFVRLP